jgi:flagella basal body P-ring formation protein FlgA
LAFDLARPPVMTYARTVSPPAVVSDSDVEVERFRNGRIANPLPGGDSE